LIERESLKSRFLKDAEEHENKGVKSSLFGKTLEAGNLEWMTITNKRGRQTGLPLGSVICGELV
jgi:hypothetical protein